MVVSISRRPIPAIDPQDLISRRVVLARRKYSERILHGGEISSLVIYARHSVVIRIDHRDGARVLVINHRGKVTTGILLCDLAVVVVPNYACDVAKSIDSGYLAAAGIIYVCREVTKWIYSRDGATVVIVNSSVQEAQRIRYSNRTAGVVVYRRGGET